VILVAAVAVSITGDLDSKLMVEQQPMKMAAAEALYESTTNAPFSILSIGDLSGENATRIIEVPGLLSFLATGSFDGKVQGINDLQAQYVQTYGAGNYVPYVPATYWGFRLMIGLGMVSALYALWVLWRFRGGRVPRSKTFVWISGLITLFPLFGISAGWIFTEMGRQPWVVFGLQQTADGVSPLVTTTEVLISFIGFTVIYAVLAVFELRILLKTIKAGPAEITSEDPFKDSKDDSEKNLYFAY
jgi:cytochrome d ubiquinol oxidase subunit I